MIVNFFFTRDRVGTGTRVPIAGQLDFLALAARTIVGTPDEIVLPVVDPVTLDEDGKATVTLPAGYWRVMLRGAHSWPVPVYVQIGSAPTGDWADTVAIPRIDPATLTPAVASIPAWEAAAALVDAAAADVAAGLAALPADVAAAVAAQVPPAVAASVAVQSTATAAGLALITAADAAAQRAALDVSPLNGSGAARFIQRARAGENLTITCLGDSILEGQTVTNPATEGAMILLAADLSARFGVTVTQTNHADSGYTALRAHINGNVAAAIAENADLYIVSAFDKNDIGADINPNAPGYALAPSVAAIERIVLAIRANVPKADIILMSTNPYTAGSSANPYQQAKGAAVRRVAAAYGCEWVDNFAAWAALPGGYASLSSDGTHPNTAGHRLIADTLLAHLSNTPRPASFHGAPAAGGLFHPERIDTLAGQFGYVSIAAPGTNGGVTYTCGGGGWVNEVTSTATDYIEASHAYCSELAIQVSTLLADAPVVDVVVDGVTVTANLALHEQGKLGAYWIAFATGLTPGSHTLRLVLRSGTLATFAVAALASRASSFIATAKEVVLSTTGVIAMDSGGGYVYACQNAAVYLPDGWGSALMVLTARLDLRVTGAIADRRYFSINLYSGSTLDTVLHTFQIATEEQRAGVILTATRVITTTATVTVDARLLSTTKTLCQITGHKVRAVLLRLT